MDERKVLLSGDSPLGFSIAACLMKAGHRVVVWTAKADEARDALMAYLVARPASRVDAFGPAPGGEALDLDRLTITADIGAMPDCELAIVVTDEDVGDKRARIRVLEACLSPEAVIAVNAESMPLSRMQEGSRRPQRIVGANWSEPAHTSLFLELIVNAACDPGLASGLFSLAKAKWGKDPYLIAGEYGVRARLFAAIAREAFYLVENGYAGVEDIDRACRNDAGYYLPFAGSLRYMDLMGPAIYGVVMNDLNPELSVLRETPALLRNLVARGGTGMENGEGFYSYEKGEAQEWMEIFTKFSDEISDLIRRYPFPHHEGNPAAAAKTISQNG